MINEQPTIIVKCEVRHMSNAQVVTGGLASRVLPQALLADEKAYPAIQIVESTAGIYLSTRFRDWV